MKNDSSALERWSRRDYLSSGYGRYNRKLFIGILPFSASSFSASRKYILPHVFMTWNDLPFWEVNLRYPHTPPHSSPWSCWVQRFLFVSLLSFSSHLLWLSISWGSLTFIESWEDRSQVCKMYFYIIIISWGPDLCLTLKRGSLNESMKGFHLIKACLDFPSS